MVLLAGRNVATRLFTAAPRSQYRSLNRTYALTLLRNKCNSAVSATKSDNRDESSFKSMQFWRSRETWKRSSINTFRCLVGCTTGDFAAMWWLQSFHPELGTALIMGVSMAAGITTSVILETLLLHQGRDKLPWKMAFRTATGMSMISMLAMETAENAVDFALTGGSVELGSRDFWIAAGIATVAGFLTPLPYNYFRLRAYKQACH